MNIDRHIKDLIFQLGLSVVYCEDMDSNGHYIELIDVIAIKSGLNELDEQLTLLHEIGHACKHKGQTELYNLAFSLHSKIENEAEVFMIEKLIPFYLDQVDKELVNWLHFMETYKINMKYEYVVRSLLSYYADSPQFRSFID